MTDIREAGAKLEQLTDDLKDHSKSFDQKLDILSQFIYSDMYGVTVAINMAADKIDKLEEECDNLQKQIDEMEDK